MPSYSIGELYFDFAPLDDHRPTCSRAGTALWEVARLGRSRLRSQESGGDYTETTLRMLCRECGVVRLERGEGLIHELTNVAQIGYGGKPSRCAGLWLHPGPLFGYRELDELGPETFYATGSATAPTAREDVIGTVSWYKTERRATRWSAGYRLTEYGNAARVPNPNHFSSKTAAARWIAEQHAAELAAGKAAAAQGAP
ncbi:MULTISPECIES: hypothetical protein [Actinomadura]|uniref:Uncharacterized protein n=1 Tax=Actinomadura yumaensis TaxID=111807 RepID=A0ABW2CXC3_9ACTN|nr:hypothetical protein [Actinomadura sp. J1-007]MWK39545.1 hypothetical protein [Actinomadura sp. J1-007]